MLARRLALGLLFFGLATIGKASPHVSLRYDWFHSGGYFHAVSGTGGGWIETLGANEAFYFKQTERNDTYVELYDATRNLAVRLYGDAMYLKASGESQFHHFYSGGWDDRRLYSAGQFSYFSLKTAQIWHWVRPGQQTLYMREILRNGDQVQLYNGAEGVTISLLENGIWMKKDGGQWFSYSSGRWN